MNDLKAINDSLNRLSFFIEGGSVQYNEVVHTMDEASFRRAVEYTIPMLLHELSELEKRYL